MFQVFTFKPPTFASGPILFVFHGQKRDAGQYRDDAIPLAEKMQAMVAVPWFDEEKYPGTSYSQGNLRREDGRLTPRKDWVFTHVVDLIRSLLRREGNLRRPYFLWGHSAGAQLLVRLTALEDGGARRILAANAGTYPFPRGDWDWPYGWGGLPPDLEGEKNLRRFLAAPLTLMLGQADTNNSPETGNFPASAEANRQGSSRLERGRNFFEAGRDLAKEKSWPFGWEKVEIRGVGHDGKLMINDLATERAMRSRNKAP